jgi:hypothetical protein
MTGKTELPDLVEISKPVRCSSAPARFAASLAVWIPPLSVVALTLAALSGRRDFHGWGGPHRDTDQLARDAAEPLCGVTVYYSSQLTVAIHTADQQGRNVLDDVDALNLVWNEVSPGRPLVIQLVRSPHSGMVVGIPNRAHHVVLAVINDRAAFTEFQPILDELRTLILEGGGSV